VLNKVNGIHFTSTDEIYSIPTNVLCFDRAWKVPAAELLANGCNLDRKNPRAKEDITHLPPDQLAGRILEKEQRIAEIMGDIQRILAKV